MTIYLKYIDINKKNSKKMIVLVKLYIIIK